jgi:hypothetical protein
MSEDIFYVVASKSIFCDEKLDVLHSNCRITLFYFSARKLGLETILIVSFFRPGKVQTLPPDPFPHPARLP